MSLRSRRLNLMTAMGLADSERAREDRAGARDAANAQRISGAISSLVPALTDAGSKVYGGLEQQAVDEATSFAAQHGDVVDQEEARDLIAAHDAFKPQEGNDPLTGLSNFLKAPMRKKAEATAAAELGKRAAANTAAINAKRTAEAETARQQANFEAQMKSQADERAASREMTQSRQAIEDQRYADERAMREKNRADDIAREEKNRAADRGQRAADRAEARADRLLREQQMREARADQRDDANTTGLRKEFNSLKEVKDFKDVGVAYKKLEEAAKDTSAAGDIGLIFAYMKMLDPGSTVREGEFATASEAGGVDAKLLNIYNKAVDGTRLTPDQRASFLKQARNNFAAQKSAYDAAVKQYGGLAGKRAGEVLPSNAVETDDPFADTRGGP